MTIDHRPVTSSNIHTIGYDPARRELHIQFKQSGRYIYHDVDAAKHTALMAAESKGKHLAKHIVSKHRASKP